MKYYVPVTVSYECINKPFISVYLTLRCTLKKTRILTNITHNPRVLSTFPSMSPKTPERVSLFIGDEILLIHNEFNIIDSVSLNILESEATYSTVFMYAWYFKKERK